jgi:5'-nucleotidase/UDP-sugar diphosphatase
MQNKPTEAMDRRTFITATAAAGVVGAMPKTLKAATAGGKTFTILHMNDLHSNFIGMAPSSDYTPFTLSDDGTRGGFARLATKIRERKAAMERQGPVLVLDAGDYTWERPSPPRRARREANSACWP